jgi:hypothetical protein
MTTPTPTPDIVQILRAFDVHDDFDRLDEAATTIEELREAVRVLGEFAAAKARRTTSAKPSRGPACSRRGNSDAQEPAQP